MTKYRKYLLTLILIVSVLLRFWRLDSVPVSLFGDELDIGYQAYSILTTGKDYMGNFLPIHLQSLAENRTPLYLYSSVPTVAIFGISPLGVRLPAAIFGVLGILGFYLLVRKLFANETLALLAALFMSLSAWHIQYSRAGFEVTQMLCLYLFGVWAFIRGLSGNKWLIISATLLALTPWSYNTAKFFLHITGLALLIIWWSDIKQLQRRYLLGSFLIFLIIVFPIYISNFFGGGGQRFLDLSLANDPTIIPNIGFARLNDAKVRKYNSTSSVQATTLDKLIHNKVTYIWGEFTNNYFQAYSTDFLFIKGDPNPRQSIAGVGEFYKIQGLLLMAGLIFLFSKNYNRRVKLLIGFWLLAAPIPAALTKDGGYHATRLFFLLPPFLILISIGAISLISIFKKSHRYLVSSVLVVLILSSFIFYQHNYWFHYPWDSQKWWQAGYQQAISVTMSEEPRYDRVIFSQYDEPSLKFFLAWSSYPPDKFQKSIPLPKEDLVGFGRSERLGKFYFPEIGQGPDLYSLGSILDNKTLYIVPFKQVKFNLLIEPERLPGDIRLIKTITLPSGEPAFYLLTK